MSASNWIALDVELIKKITDKAMLVVVDGEEHWLPLSCCEEADDYEEGDMDRTVCVAEWIARQKGLV